MSSLDNLFQNIFGKVKGLSKIGQDQKTVAVISIFVYFFLLFFFFFFCFYNFYFIYLFFCLLVCLFVFFTEILDKTYNSVKIYFCKNFLFIYKNFNFLFYYVPSKLRRPLQMSDE